MGNFLLPGGEGMIKTWGRVYLAAMSKNEQIQVLHLLQMYFSVNTGEINPLETPYVVDVSRSAGGRVFLFSWERLGRGL